MSSRSVVDLRARRVPARRGTSSSSRPPREQKRMPLRARRRRISAALWFSICLVLCAAAYGVHWVSYLPQFNVSRIEVTGAKLFPPELIKTFEESELYDGSFAYISHSSIFFFHRERMEQDLVANFPRIKSARISRSSSFSPVMYVDISERQPFAKWCGAAPVDQFASTSVSDALTCYQMDDTGYVFAWFDATSTPHSAFAEPYEFTGDISREPIGSTFIPGRLLGLLELLATLKQQVNVHPVSVKIESAQDFAVTFAQGYSLKASFGVESGTLARNLKLVLNSESLSAKQDQLEYVDLRFGNKVYFKLQGVAE